MGYVSISTSQNLSLLVIVSVCEEEGLCMGVLSNFKHILELINAIYGVGKEGKKIRS